MQLHSATSEIIVSTFPLTVLAAEMHDVKFESRSMIALSGKLKDASPDPLRQYWAGVLTPFQ
jgi:hypothetical protein